MSPSSQTASCPSDTPGQAAARRPAGTATSVIRTGSVLERRWVATPRHPPAPREPASAGSTRTATRHASAPAHRRLRFPTPASQRHTATSALPHRQRPALRRLHSSSSVYHRTHAIRTLNGSAQHRRCGYSCRPLGSSHQPRDTIPTSQPHSGPQPVSLDRTLPPTLAPGLPPAPVGIALAQHG